MNEATIRSRYPQKSYIPNKRNTKKENKFSKKILYQMVLSISIMAVLMLIQRTNTYYGNLASKKIKEVVFQNIEVSSIYNNINNYISKTGTNDINKLFDNIRVLNSNGKLIKKNEKAVNEIVGGAGSIDYSSIRDTAINIDNSNNPILDKSIIKETNVNTEKNVDQKKVTENIKATPKVTKNTGYILPVNGTLESGFGERIHPIKKTKEYHKGLDIAAAMGADIRASRIGEVILATEDSSFGKYVKIFHDNNTITLYAHCSQLLVKKGQKVKQAELIAKVGATGLANGPHLHFELWRDGKVVNPLGIIEVPKK